VTVACASDVIENVCPLPADMKILMKILSPVELFTSVLMEGKCFFSMINGAQEIYSSGHLIDILVDG